jgi:hypothetical protein
MWFYHQFPTLSSFSKSAAFIWSRQTRNREAMSFTGCIHILLISAIVAFVPSDIKVLNAFTCMYGSLITFLRVYLPAFCDVIFRSTTPNKYAICSNRKVFVVILCRFFVIKKISIRIFLIDGVLKIKVKQEVKKYSAKKFLARQSMFDNIYQTVSISFKREPKCGGSICKAAKSCVRAAPAFFFRLGK